MKAIKNVLVVDNNRVFCSFMHEILESEGYIVEAAESGLDALEKLKAFAADVVFVDRVMPEINGDELCRLMRSRPETRGALLVVLSAIAVEDPAVSLLDQVDACLAKMAFSDMKPLVLRVLEDLSAGRTEQYRNRVVGVEKLYEREITRELLESKRHLETFLKAGPHGALELNADGVIVSANANACRLLGRADRDLLTRRFAELFEAAQVRDSVSEALRQVSSEPNVLGEDGRITISGRQITITLTAVEAEGSGSMLVLLYDATEWFESRRRVEDLLEEKQTLLRELEHRVRNNLSMVTGLLRLQAESVTSAEAAEALGEAEGRVRSMLSIYDILSTSGIYQEVELGTFLRDLCRGLASAFATSSVRLECRLGRRRHVVPAQAAMALGLVVNELVTNAYKHAFAGREAGEVTVSLTRERGAATVLRIADNGLGLPDAVYSGAKRGFGLELVYAELEQIEAGLEIERNGGTVFSIRL